MTLVRRVMNRRVPVAAPPDVTTPDPDRLRDG